MKSKKTHQYSVKMGDKTHGMFRALQAQNDEASNNMIFIDSVRFAHANGMYTNRLGNNVNVATNPPTGLAPTATTPPKKKKDDSHPLLDSFNDFGITLDQNGIVSYTKYEKIPTGRIVRNSRSHSVKELPDEYHKLSRFILGPFMSLMDAERAYEEQSEEKQDRGLNKDDNIKL